MKKTFAKVLGFVSSMTLLVGAASVATFASVSAATETGVVANGSFERGLADWTVPEGLGATASTKEHADGSKSLEHTEHAVRITQKVTVKPNTKYEFAASVKTNGMCEVQIYNVADEGNYESNNRVTYIEPHKETPNSDGWSTATLWQPFDTGDATEYIIALMPNAYGMPEGEDYYCYFDNIVLKEIVENPAEFDNLLLNGSFEEGPHYWSLDTYIDGESGARLAEVVNEKGAPDGVNSLKILGKGWPYGGPTQEVKVEKNTKYYFSIMAKSLSKWGSAVKFKNKAGTKEIAPALTIDPAPVNDKGEPAWTRFSAVIDSGENETILIELMNNQEKDGDAQYFDNAILRKAPERSAENLILNPGFEDGFNYWTDGGYQFAEINEDETYIRSGSKSVNMPCVDGLYSGPGQYVPVEKNTDYKLTYYVWANAGCKMQVEDAKTGAIVCSADINANTGWELVEREFNSGEMTEVRVTFISIALDDSGESNAYYDDFKMYKKADAPASKNLIVKDEATGIKVEFMALNEDDAYTGVASLKVSTADVTASAAAGLKDKDLVAADSMFILEFKDAEGAAVTEFGGRQIRISFPVDKYDSVVNLFQDLGDSLQFITMTEDGAGNAVATLDPTENEMVFRFVLGIYDDGESDDNGNGNGDDNGNDNGNGGNGEKDPSPDTGVAFPAAVAGLLAISAAAVLMSRKKSK